MKLTYLIDKDEFLKDAMEAAEETVKMHKKNGDLLWDPTTGKTCDKNAEHLKTVVKTPNFNKSRIPMQQIMLEETLICAKVSA